MLTAIAAIIIGFILLVWSADRFVAGAAATAADLGASSLIIGLTIVGFGTSAPEILISSLSAWQGNPGLAVGNAIGSNIANMALILGAAAVIAPMVVDSGILRREMPMLVGVMLLTLLLLWDLSLSRLDGTILLLALVGVMYWLIRQSMRDGSDFLGGEYDEEIPHDMPMKTALMWTAVGLTVLVASSQLLVWGAVEIATWLGMSDLVIGLSIVAIGTSLPELATSVAAAMKREHGIALGNVIGSNIFNSLAVLGLPGLIAPHAIAPEVLSRDMSVQFAVTLLAIAMAARWFGRPGRINRTEGGILLVCFVAYQVMLFYHP
jgi:cation:H+ antiporter